MLVMVGDQAVDELRRRLDRALSRNLYLGHNLTLPPVGDRNRDAVAGRATRHGVAPG
jgi:hypothetical protein